MGTAAIGLVCFLCGMLAGVIIWEKIGTGDTYKGKIRFKQRGRGNVQTTDIKPEIKPILSRRRKRLNKRLDRLNKKD